MKLHKRHSVITKAKLEWSQTKTGGAEYHYEDLMLAFCSAEVLPGVDPEQDGMIEAMRADFNRVCEEHELTTGERVAVIADILSGNAKYMVRWERHGDFDTPGNWAGEDR